ncbi:type ISP restriction/modification enzyme [Ruminococcus sp.]|uniref:type ISP restriction/modification enzyme n=1 Tax=Ruminococcus sp. TaxID=41978 RepID=UPI0025FA47C9|nr:type ISP restriction/modification enzyme [Ruminococcus sp.]
MEILTHTNTDLILKDFNRQTGGGREDPVIHFYEEFLTAYDKAQKVQRGVYYTPQPVVNFIVRAVDSILKTEFGLADGLASEETKTVKYMREKIRGQGMTEDTKEVSAVQILDPATGTGTFLRQTILQIYDNFRAKHSGESEAQIKKAWNEYVPKHLLPRLNGFELMMAPYAVAHMKLAMVLKDTGYDFGGDHRLNVFLTNSLEEAGKDDFQMTLFDNDPLAFESIEANQAKKNNGINVIIGNPPYSSSSSNKGEWIQNLISEYKKGLTERKYNLDDDYIKFIRLGEYFLENSENGILAYISNNGFLDGVTYRVMREHILNLFDTIYIINLHGNIKKKECADDGGKDENVFDIQQGVSIGIFVKNKGHDKSTKVYYMDIKGERDHKYKLLNNLHINDVNHELKPFSPNFFFVKKDFNNKEIYEKGIKLDELFPLYNSGVQSKRDKLTISFNEQQVNSIIDDMQTLPAEELRYKYELPADGRDWKIIWAKEDIINHNPQIIKFLYRPFDWRYTAYTGYSKGFLAYPRDKVFKYFIESENISIITVHFQTTFSFQHAMVSQYVSDLNSISMQTGEQSFVFPLYTFDYEYNAKSVNIQYDLATKLLLPIGIKYNDEMALQLFDYIYAILYSPKYREKYKEFLKIDFPRVPYPTDQDTFWKLVEIGGKLRECHLMQTEFDTAAYSFIGDGTNEVVKPEYKNGRVYISKTQYFDNVPQAQWEQYIGGYQPLQKWLKDRKKTMLSAEDIEHYKKIIAALKLTEELMAEIDESILKFV